MFRFSANKAFRRTHPHPADERMRLTHDPADVIAILSREARGVILKSAPAPEFMEACRVFTQEPRPALHGSAIALSGYAAPLWPVAVTAPLRADCMLRLRQLKEIFGRGEECEANFVIEKESRAQSPHFDAPFRNETKIAMIRPYCDTRDLMTLWHPGDRTFAQSREIGAAFARAADKAAFLKDLNAQQLEPGDTLFFKILPDGRGTRPAECLLHNRPAISGQVTRACFFGTV